MDNNWFTSRGFKVLEYQNQAITKVQDSLAVNDMEIPVKKVYQRTPSTGEPTKPQQTKARKYQPIDMEGLPVFEFFKNILHKKDQLLTTYCMTTVRDVRAEFLDRMPTGFWDIKINCTNDAKNYATRSEWGGIIKSCIYESL